MNPFEYFLSVKGRIEQDPAIMQNLLTYACGDRSSFNVPLEKIDEGRHNIHFRLGELNPGIFRRNIWLATRELKPIHPEYDLNASQLKNNYEWYITKALIAHKKGYSVPRMIGGVKSNMTDTERYFLILEDLTRGGKADFKPVNDPIERFSSVVSEGYAIVDGRIIHHDFRDEFRAPNKFDYMVEGKMIELRQ